MEICPIFNSIQRDARDAADLADEFIKAKLPAQKVELELIRLIFNSVSIKDKIDENLIKDKDIVEVVEFVQNKSKNVRESSTPIHDGKFFKRCLSFFERVFILNWSTLTNDGNFEESFFMNLLEELSECDSRMIYVICFVIRLKIVTAYLRGACVEDEQKSMPQVKKYAQFLVEKGLFYRSVQCPISACSELYEWIKKDDSFANDRNLRLIAWCMKMEKPKLACHALLIAYSLLRMEHLCGQLVLFVHKLVSVFEDLCFHDNDCIFDWICRCCEPIYKNHRAAILAPFLKDLLDNLFCKRRFRAKSVARFWINSVFEPNCHRKNIRTMLKFLQGKGQEHWKLVVDSLIDEYPFMLDFKQHVDILFDNEAVPDDIRLTMEEKEGFLRLMSYTIEELVTGFPPDIRADNTKRLNLTICHEYSCQVTEALLPRFWDLFNLPYENKERAQIRLIFIGKFFNFPVIERATMIAFVLECSTIFRTTCQAFCYQVVMDMLRLIMNNYRDEEIKRLCENVFFTLKNYYESKFDELIDDLIKNPDKYNDLNDEPARIAEIVAIQILALNRFLTLSKACSIDSTRKLLEFEARPRNKVFVCILYVSVGLMCDYIISATETLKEICEEHNTKPEEYDDIMGDIDYLVKTLSIKLREWYPWSDLTVATFMNLCKALGVIRSLPLAENSWLILVPIDARYLIASFVAQMVWTTNDSRVEVPQGTKTCILKCFFKSIGQRVLPLFYAYDAMTNLRKARQVIEKPLLKFIQDVCALIEESVVAVWILDWSTCLFQLSPKDCLDVVGDFVKLIYPIRKEIQDIICVIIIKGIDFAFSNEIKQSRDQSPKSRVEFLNMILKLSECIDAKRKTTVENYFRKVALNKINAKKVNSFVTRLQKRAPRQLDKSASMAKPTEPLESILSSRRTSLITPEESELPWSPSSIAQSYSVLADESDLSSLDSIDSVFVIRSMTRPNDRPKVHSTPFKDDETRAESRPFVFDNMVQLVEILSENSVKEPKKDENKSSEEVCTAAELAIASTSNVKPSSKRKKRKNPSTSSKKGPASISTVDVDMVSEPKKSKSPSLSGGDDSIAKDSANISISDANLLDKNPTGPDVTVELPLLTQTKTTSRSRYNSSKFGSSLKNTTPVNDDVLDDRSPISTSGKNDDDESDSVNEPVHFTDSSPSIPTRDFISPIKSPHTKANDDTQVESTSQIYDNVTKLLETLNKSPVNDTIFDNSSLPVVSSYDRLNVESMETSPTKSSPQAPVNNTQAESMSQIYDNALKFVNSLNAENSSASPSSGDDDSMKKRLNTSISDSPVSSPQAKQNNAKVASTSPMYDDLRKFVKNLYEANSSAPTWSGDDEIMKSLLNTDMVTSPRANVAQAQSTSQMIDNAKKFVSSLNAENSSASVSSGDDDSMKKRLNFSINSLDSLVDVSPMEYSEATTSPSSSPQAKRNDAQVESTLQQYDNIRKLVKSLNNENSSASASSGDDDVVKNLLNDSISEAELLDATSTRPMSGVIEDTQDLYNILVSDSDEQNSYGASKVVNDVAKNLQRFSLSNNESDESDS